ncbi:MAG: thioredoxin [Rhizobiales bacterium]|nr:thioredoxin [Hyphomicrobiales bacterium]OJY46163.1 MAG: hypothetical protein BGP08_07535 [Rhizobiales bacterium 64-17]
MVSLRLLLSAVLIGLALAAQPARAAELIMFERAACPWCEAFDREIAPIYPKTASGKLAPLRRVDIYGKLPADLAFVQVERITPVFVLVDQGRELGRIRGYPGEDHFWGLFDAMVERTLGKASDQEKSLRIKG